MLFKIGITFVEDFVSISNFLILDFAPLIVIPSFLIKDFIFKKLTMSFFLNIL